MNGSFSPGEPKRYRALVDGLLGAAWEAQGLPYRKDGTGATLVMLLPNSVLLEGNCNVPMDVLRSAFQSIPVAKIGALQR